MMTEAAQQQPGDRAAEKRGARQRRALERAMISASTLLLVAIVLMVNYLAFRNYRRMDWTSEGMFTLSAKSLAELRRLDEDIDVYLFLSQAEPDFMHVDELMRRYKAASEHVKVHYVDPDREPGEFKVLAQRFGVFEAMTGAGEVRADVAAVVARGDKNWHVGREDLVGWEMGEGDQGGELNVKAEQALTGAIVQVISGRATRVCVTAGHGEWSLEEGEERSISALKLGLRHDNIEWTAFETLGAKDVPKDCDAVLVLGPLRAFSAAEAKLILDWVQAGGNALLALDPVIEHDQIQPTGFEDALKALNVRLDSSLAIELDPKRLLSPNTVEFAITEFGDHDTTRALKGRAHVVVALARSLSLLQPSDRVEPLLRTSEQAFGATDISRVMTAEKEPERAPGDISGPLDVAFAVRTAADPDAAHDKPGGRLIVVGDSDLLMPALLEAPELANFHLASAWTGWLTERDALVEIPAKKVKGGTAMFTQDDLSGLFFRVGVLLPAAALLFGFMVWFTRRA
jgi:ABC-2 type transport system permease protein